MRTGYKIVAAALALLAFTGTAMADLSDGLVVKYSFDSIGTNGELADESGNGHTLTLGSGLSLTNGPLPGMKAIRFDGTSASWAQYDGFALTNRTVSFWVCADAANSATVDGYPYIITALGTLNVYNGGKAGKTNPEQTYAICGQTFSGALTFTRKNWYHHVLSISFANDDCQMGSTFVVKHYLDGKLDYTSGEASVASRGDKTGTVTIGNKDSNGSRAFLGSVANFRVWNRTLSDEEAASLYAGDVTGRDPVLVAYWPLDEILEVNGVRSSPNKAACGFPTFTDLYLIGNNLVATNGIYDGAVKAGSESAGGLSATNNLSGGLADWSLSLWMKHPWVPTANSVQRFIALSDFSRMLTFKNNRNLRWCLGNGRTGTPYWLASDALFGLEAWTHVVLTVSFGVEGTNQVCNVSIYANGEKQETTFDNGDNSEIPNRVDYICWRNSYITLGGRPWAQDANDATIDDAAIFSGVLSAEQVKALYSGSPKVNAGEDFSTAEAVARLEGRTVRHVGTVSVPEPGAYAWRLVSAPAGGEGAAFPNGNAGLSTIVTLPVAGTYEFELYSVDSLLPRTDRVVVTRVSSSGANTPPAISLAASASVTLPAPLVLSPTVSDSDSGPGSLVTRWSKVSGPGGAWFDTLADGSTRLTFGAAGTYVVRLTASDGSDDTTADCTVTVSAAAQDINTDLIHYWGLNTNVYSAAAIRDEVSGVTVSSPVSAPQKTLAAGVTGYAFQPNFNTTGVYWDTNVNLDETPTIADTANSRPTNEYVTVSAWVYVRPGDTNNVAGGIVVGQNLSWDVEFSHPDNPNAFSLMQQGDKKAYSEGEYTYGSMGYSILHFPASSTPFTGRWTHVAAVFDRWGKDCNTFFIDGTKVAHSSRESLEKCAGRPNNSDIFIGGRPTGAANTPIYNSNYTNALGVALSRCFPGIIDEVKIWKQKLSDAEIAYLAANPAPQNREPQVDPLAVSAVTAVIGSATALPAPTAYDDGLPSGSTLSGSWEVVSGDASAVTFSGNGVTVDAKGEYVIRYAATDGRRTSYSDAITVTGVARGMVMIIK